MLSTTANSKFSPNNLRNNNQNERLLNFVLQSQGRVSIEALWYKNHENPIYRKSHTLADLHQLTDDPGLNF